MFLPAGCLVILAGKTPSGHLMPMAAGVSRFHFVSIIKHRNIFPDVGWNYTEQP
jgi:hypothetical protein